MEKEELFYLSMKEWQRQVRIKKAKDFVKSIPQKLKNVWDEDKELVLFLAPGGLCGEKSHEDQIRKEGRLSS